MKPLVTNLAPWVLGSVVAFSGVALVRLEAPTLKGSTRIGAVLAGFALATFGLFIIARGVNRRLARVPKDTPDLD